MTNPRNDEIRAWEARLNVTWMGQNGDLPDPVANDASDVEIKAWVLEALRSGDIPGIDAAPRAVLDDFVVDRFGPTQEVPYSRIFVRPKTPFGR